MGISGFQEEIREEIKRIAWLHKTDANDFTLPISKTDLNNYSREISRLRRGEARTFYRDQMVSEQLVRMAAAGVPFHRAMKNLGLR